MVKDDEDNGSLHGVKGLCGLSENYCMVYNCVLIMQPVVGKCLDFVMRGKEFPNNKSDSVKRRAGSSHVICIILRDLGNDDTVCL